MKRLLQLLIVLSFVPLLFACVGKSNTTKHTITMATTTSTDNSGLLDYLKPYFEEDTGITWNWVAVGTGAALEMGRNKEADILMVHDTPNELIFMKDGYGLKRTEFMFNDFVLVGPKNSPLNTDSLVNVLKGISDNGYTFISRGDKSGTNSKELSLWKQVDITPSGSWYIESGQGMGATLNMASEKQAYTLSDRATYLAMKDSLDLKIVYENPVELKNQYGVILVMPNVKKNINTADAQVLYDWVISDRGQNLIEQFGKDQYGQQLFFANAPRD